MNKYELKGTDTIVYNETLPNGLDVYLVNFPNKKNYYMSYFTKFGSINTSFIPNGEKDFIKVPDGTAHFLEHKMFEQENGDTPFEFYSKNGSSCNASTGFKVTNYIVYGTNNLEKNLTYLINYLNSPYFTDENVEKEKGIIGEEIKMYDDSPEWTLTKEVEKAIFKNHPIRNDIAGSVETIATITKEHLYSCYNTFYQPSNMGLVVGGDFDPNKIMELIKNNPLLKNKKKMPLPIIKEIEEPLEVNSKLIEKERHNVVIPKAGFSIKLSLKKIKDVYTYNLYVGMILNIIFGTSSSFREKMMRENKMNSLMFDRMHVGEFLIITFWIESNVPKELIQNIIEEFNNYEITSEEMERCKKVWISSEVIMTDNVELTVDNIINDIIEYDKVIYDRVPLIRKMNIETLQKIKKDLSFTNNSIVILSKETL